MGKNKVPYKLIYLSNLPNLTNLEIRLKTFAGTAGGYTHLKQYNSRKHKNKRLWDINWVRETSFSWNGKQ